MKKLLLFVFAAVAFAACEQLEDIFNNDGDEIMSGTVPSNEIWYTSSDGNITPYITTGFGANIVSNEYKDGIGVITFDDDVTTIGNKAFYYCTSLTSVNIPDSVTTIGVQAFRDCDSLTSVNIPDSVTTIGEALFTGCGSLTEFKGKFASEDGRSLIVNGILTSFAPGGLTEYTIPDSVTTIGLGAFYYCTSLTSVTIGDSVTTIGDAAFRDCTSLTSVNIPDSVTTIGEEAFYHCKSLTSVYCKATTPPALGSYVFDNNCSGRKIYVPTESVEAYKSATNWNEYASAIIGYDF